VWLKNGRKYYSPPKIENIDEFSKSWWVWWRALQPKWRIMTDGSLLKQLPEDGETWANIYKGGSNGFFMLILTLAWWLVAINGNTEEDGFNLALVDTMWVLDGMIAMPSHKRGSDELDSEGVTKKR
jgi:hypothetical protein